MVCGYKKWHKKQWREKAGYGVSWLSTNSGMAFVKGFSSPMQDSDVSAFDRAINFKHRHEKHSFLLKWNQGEGRVLIGNFFEPSLVFKSFYMTTYLDLFNRIEVCYDEQLLDQLLAGVPYHHISRVYQMDESRETVFSSEEFMSGIMSDIIKKIDPAKRRVVLDQLVKSFA